MIAEKLYYIARWIAILPVAIIGYLLPVWSTYYAVDIFLDIQNPWIKIILSVVSTFYGCIGFIVFGTRCCPKRYAAFAAITLSILLSACLGMMICLVIALKGYREVRTEFVISGITGLTAVVITCISQVDEYWTAFHYGQIDDDLDAFKR